MARYNGPACKICRREGMKLLLKGERCMTPKCAIEHRSYPPGSNGQRRPRKGSDYGLQLREKQKVRRTYGIMERQFRKHFEEAERTPGVTGTNLLRILELRLDNVAYRLTFGDSRRQARQLVRHGHFCINGHRANVPSMILKPGDTVSVSDNSKNLEYFKILSEVLGKGDVPEWLSLDPKAMAGRVVRPPDRDDVDAAINEALIVEHYSR